MIVGTEWLIEAAGCSQDKLRGVTGLVALTESHLACHTYPEHRTATFNLYCCRTRPEWDWEVNLKTLLEAATVSVLKIERGNLKSGISNLKSQSAGGDV